MRDDDWTLVDASTDDDGTSNDQPVDADPSELRAAGWQRVGDRWVLI